MTDVLFVEIAETPSEFVRELKAGGPDVRLLQESVTEPIVCDYSNVNTLLLTPELREASEPVREQPPPGTLRTRAYANFTLNNDVSYDLTSQTIPGVRSTLNQLVATQKLKSFMPNGVYDSILTKGLDESITINQTGYYRIVVNLNLAFYPTGMGDNQASVNYKGVSDNALTQTPVQINLAVKVGTNTRYVVLGEDFISKSDFELGRPRQLIGEVMLQLSQGNSFTLNVARGPTMGVMRKTGAADLDEVLGLRKTRYVVPGSIPQRDALNYMEIYRLA